MSVLLLTTNYENESAGFLGYNQTINIRLTSAEPYIKQFIAQKDKISINKLTLSASVGWL